MSTTDAHESITSQLDNGSLRKIARRLGFELTVVPGDMPIEATRIGSRLLAMNFADLDELVAWLDLHDRAAHTA